MKRIKTLSVVWAISLFFSQSFAQNRIDFSSDSPDEIILNIEIVDWDLNKVDAPRGTSYLLAASGAKAILEKGAPDIPKLVRSIIIPDFDLMAVEVTPLKFVDFDNIEIAPSKGYFLRNQNPDSIPYTYGEWYSSDAFFPGKLAALNEPYILRDFRGQALDIFPFQYNAVTKKLRVYTELSVKVYSTGETGENVMHGNRKSAQMTSEFQEIYSKHFINYNENLRYTPLEEEGSMLIICDDDFMSAMEPFVDWKNIIGLSTEMVALTSVGSTPAEIKAYISNYYNTSNLVYVLFVGDAEQIPPYTAGLIEGYSDNAYGYLAGSDRYQEVFVGRFSAQNLSQVQTQVQRSIEYEQAYNFSNGWLHHGLGIARNEGAGGGHNGEADYVHMDIIRDKLLTYTYDVVYREYDGNVPGLTNTTAALISQRINDGVSVINFCNHGSVTGWSVAGYDTAYVNALSNTGKLPFIWSVACVNGQFQGKTCFAEYWLRATDNTGNPTGAVATFMSTINQPWVPPMDAQDEFNDIMIESYSGNIKRSYGGISINGVYKMLDLNPNSNGYKTAETWTIFGDPSLKIRTDDAIAMNVNHGPHITFGADYFELSCDAEDAYAALTLNGEIMSTATETGGWISLPIGGLELGDVVTLAITAYNRIPYIIQLDVPPVNVPIVETAVVEEISSSSALLGGNVVESGGGEITERGVYWSPEPDPEVTGVKLIIGNGTGSFSATLDGLLPKTNYYVKAYAINSAGTAFGDEEVFTTLMQENLQLEDVIINAIMDTCYDASQVITVAGNGCIFWVEPGAVAELVAGQSIHFLEGTHVKHDSHLLARIALNGDYCGNPEPLPMVRKEEIFFEEPVVPIIPETLLFHVYPNPTNGIFTLDFTGIDPGGKYSVIILNMMGKEILREAFSENHLRHFDLSGMPAGIYILQILTGTESGVAKIIRQ
jgi:hypothetical protein